MDTGAVIVAHLVGDYVLQSDWMATEKTTSWAPALAHAASYTAPFLALTRSPRALLTIAGTHAVIDRYRLARHLCWAKNLAAPTRHRHPWAECSATGYHESHPPWLAFWLMIAADNTAHLLIDAAAVRWL